ncbi:amino acid ABC transporter substrate-binding protein, PAAT family [Pseudomonas guineae]|uniref:Amino acid ABC transporter substrate-binding protein, PAAT family n=1 Tax=Pseudomonas guineae TaxID=425504 RepID=A0A1I3PDD9_9PSED|nr:transporter substrate-binding domain-containing protein [Pseudomonas guineae]SFJ19545.1 amino acid ABC transporter substrate-binding protein, PAAT family [Pseudomonas guineae]
MLKLLLTPLLLMLSAVTLADERAIRFSINDSWAMPILRFEQGRAVEGILFDLQQQLAARVGRKAEFLVMPSLRVHHAMNNGDIDVRCYVSPNWVNNSHPQFIWSRPFMVQRDLLVGTHAEARQPEQLHDERLGTVMGFSYPRLEPLFASGQIQREDGRTQEQVLLKLGARRYNYAISNDLSLHWFNRNRAPQQHLHALSELASEPVACIIRDAADVPTMTLLRAMVQMEQEGEFAALLARYR